jgi:hypothetical protein
MDARGPRARWAVASWLLGLAAIVAVVFFAARFGHAREFGELLRTMRPGWLVVAAGLQVGTYACDATIWRRVLMRAGSPQPFPRMLGLSIARLFLRQAVPSGGVSGDVLVVRALSKYGVPFDASMTALVVNLFGFYASLALGAVGAGIAFYAIDAARGPILAVAVPFSLLLVAIPAVLAWLVHSAGQPHARWHRIPLLRNVLDAFGRARRDLLRDRWLMAQAVVLQVATVAFDAATLGALLAALGRPVLVMGWFAAFVLASAAELVGPMPGGLGAFEGGCILGLKAFGVSVETALLSTLALRGFTFWLPMIPGVFVARWAVAPGPDAGGESPVPSVDRGSAGGERPARVL